MRCVRLFVARCCVLCVVVSCVVVSCVVVSVFVFVEWLIIVRESLLLETLTSAKIIVDFRPCNVCFCFTSNENCDLSLEKRRSLKKVSFVVVCFLFEKVSFLMSSSRMLQKIMEIVIVSLICCVCDNTPLKSSKISHGHRRPSSHFFCSARKRN